MIQRLAAIGGWRIVRLIVSAAVYPVLTRTLSPEQFGEYAFLLAVYGMTQPVTNSVVLDGVRKFTAETQRSGSNRRLKYEVALWGLICACVWIGCVAGGAVLLHRFGIGVGVTVKNVELAFFGIWLIADVLFFAIRGLGMGMQQERWTEAGLGLRSLAWGVGCLFVHFSNGGVTGVLIAHLAGAVIGTILIVMALRHELSYELKEVPRIKLQTAKKLIRFSAANALVVLLVTSIHHFDIASIRFLVDDTATGVYKTALIPLEGIWLAAAALQLLLLHEGIGRFEKRDVRSMVDFASPAVRGALVVGLVMSSVLAVYGAEIVSMYFGAAYGDAGQLLIILIPGALVYVAMRPMIGLYQGAEQFGLLVVPCVIAAICNVGLNVFLITKLGPIGAAIATSASYTLLGVLLLRRSGKASINLTRAMRLREFAGSAVCLLPVVIAANIGESISEAVVGLLLIASVIVFLIRCDQTGALSRMEVSDVLWSTDA